jgi:hypothetical protein
MRHPLFIDRWYQESCPNPHILVHLAPPRPTLLLLTSVNWRCRMTLHTVVNRAEVATSLAMDTLKLVVMLSCECRRRHIILRNALNLLVMLALRLLHGHSSPSRPSYMRLHDWPLPRLVARDTNLPSERRSIHTPLRRRHYIKAILSVLLRERHLQVTSMRGQ